MPTTDQRDRKIAAAQKRYEKAEANLEKHTAAATAALDECDRASREMGWLRDMPVSDAPDELVLEDDAAEVLDTGGVGFRIHGTTEE